MRWPDIGSLPSLEMLKEFHVVNGIWADWTKKLWMSCWICEQVKRVIRLPNWANHWDVTKDTLMPCKVRWIWLRQGQSWKSFRMIRLKQRLWRNSGSRFASVERMQYAYSGLTRFLKKLYLMKLLIKLQRLRRIQGWSYLLRMCFSINYFMVREIVSGFIICCLRSIFSARWMTKSKRNITVVRWRFIVGS